jgi:NAD(P)-dependent dehydrogenase (short-subunit alcohol dehydrogenase family)
LYGCIDIDCLINNSGANWGESIDTYPANAFEKVMNLNVNRLFTLTQACLPLLRAKASTANPSSVINIGSINGMQPPNLETYAYSSSKAAVHHLTKHLASR